jgi:DNA-binding transcriptional MerR regulator
MDKAVEAFRTISEVADELGIAKHVLRFWEDKFVHIRPMKRGGGRRYYRPEDLELLRGVRHLLHREGYTIKGVQKILREQGVEAVKLFGRDPEAPAQEVAAGTPTAPPRPVSGEDGARRRGRPAGSGGAQSAKPKAHPARQTAIRAMIATLEECRELLTSIPHGQPDQSQRAIPN